MNKDVSARHGYVLVIGEAVWNSLPGLMRNLSGSLLEVLANLELHHGTRGNRHVLGGILGVTANLGLDFLHGESTEIAQDNTVAVAESLGNQLNGLLNNVEDVVLREVAVELSADLVHQFSFSNRISHNFSAFFRMLEKAGGL